MWKIVIVTLMACSDPQVYITSYEYLSKADCELGMKFRRPQFDLIPGSILECRRFDK